MAKFYGAIGYAVTNVTAPGVWVDAIVEKPYTGDILKKVRRWNQGENVNPDVTISDTISIIADGFALENAALMKYVKWLGTNWTISSIDVQYPRVTLELGGVYNGRTGDPEESS